MPQVRTLSPRLANKSAPNRHLRRSVRGGFFWKHSDQEGNGLTPLAKPAAGSSRLSGAPCQRWVHQERQELRSPHPQFWWELIKLINQKIFTPKWGLSHRRSKPESIHEWIMVDMARSLFLTIWASCSVMGFQNSMPPRLKRRIALSEQANHSRTLLDGHTTCLMPPIGMGWASEAS